jgi:parallel beta-helix repeat protein
MSQTDYPTALDTFSTKKDDIDYVMADHINKMQDAIAALQARLGISSDGNPLLRTFSKVVATDESGDYQCDGTDDDVQIQAAIDAVEVAGGGTVFVRAGTYVLGAGLVIDSANVTLQGEGAGATIIQAKSELANATDIITVSGSLCSLEKFTLDGNKANQTTKDHGGVKMSGATSKIIDIEVKNVSNNSGFYPAVYCLAGINGYIDKLYTHDNESYGVYLSGSADRWQINSIQSISNGNIGIYLAGDYTNVVNCLSKSNTGQGFWCANWGNHMTNCVSEDNSADGFWIDTNEVSLVNCRSTGNGADGITATGVRGKIISCFLDNNSDHGIILSGADNFIVSGNVISANGGSNGLSADNTFSGIHLVSTATRNVVSGNRILKIAGVNDYAYGIREASAADNYNNISGNIVTNAQTAQVSTQGANTVTDGSNITA